MNTLLLPLLGIAMTVSTCGNLNGLFRQQSDTNGSEISETLTSSNGDASDGTIAAYPEGLFGEAELKISEGASINSSALSTALEIDGIIDTVSASINISASSDVDESQIWKLQITIPTDGNLEFALVENLKLAIIYHVKLSGKSIFGIIPRKLLKLNSGAITFSAVGFGNYQAALLPTEVTETRSKETTDNIKTKVEEVEEEEEEVEVEEEDDDEVDDSNSDSNTGPILTDPGDKSFVLPASLSFNLSASDADGDTLSYSCAANCPAGLSLNSATGTVAWSADGDQVGTHTDVTFSVSDGSLTSSHSIDITVNTQSIISTNIVMSVDAKKYNGSTFEATGCSNTTWTDLSGNAINGTLNSYSSCDTTSGWNGGGTMADPYRLEFDGTNDKVNFGSDNTLNLTNEISFSTWMRADVAGSPVDILSKGTTGSPPYMFMLRGTNYLKPSFLMKTILTTPLNSSTELTVGEWTHITWTFDGTTAKIYINGQEDVSSTIATSSIHTDASSLLLGARSTNFLNGAIAVATLYDVALTAAQVLQNCEANYHRFSGASCN